MADNVREFGDAAIAFGSTFERADRGRDAPKPNTDGSGLLDELKGFGKCFDQIRKVLGVLEGSFDSESEALIAMRLP